MFKKLLTTLTLTVVALSMFWVASAQDDSMRLVTTLEELTAESSEFYGETVTLEGTIMEFVNSSSFVLGEDAAIDDDRILVLNNSGEMLPIELFRGDFVVVTGIVHSSLEVHIDEMLGEADDDNVDSELVDAMDVSTNVLNYYLTGNFPEDFDGFTVLELTSIEDVEFVVEEE